MSAPLPEALAKLLDATPSPDPSAVAILVVNDTAAQRFALRAALEPLGHTVIEADSGLAALRCIMEQDFAVILLDVCMPEMDGFETAALIRQRRQSEMTPLIFITAYGSDEIGDENLYAEGAVDFIYAPVPPVELRAKVSAFVRLFVRAEELAALAVEVQASADEFWLLTDAAPIGIFQTDTLNRYVYTNPRWSEITGIPPEEAAGQDWATIVGAEIRAGMIDDLADAVSGPELSHRIEIRRLDGPTRIAQVTSKEIRGIDDGVVGGVGTLADVTAEAGVEAAMADARDKANEASRLKSDFLANMSHEIRTPMNGVLGMTDLLLETDLDPRQRDYAQTVRNSGEALLTIINDILDFSKVEAGKLQIEAIEFDVRTIVDDVVDLLAGPAQVKGLELIAVTAPAVPAAVHGDPGRVRQVLTNLIGNAIKFTQAGEIVVRVAVAPAPGAEDRTIIHFSVSDTGDGIAPDKLAAVFQPFVQADSSTSRKYGGTGLGLAISSQLVSLMGGDCGATSELDVGSTFWFTIAVHADTETDGIESAPPDDDLAGIAALIVDDNATVRKVLADYMTGWGMSVAAAESGEAALAAMRAAVAAERPFAVALLDRSMPAMDRLALKATILADPDLTARLVLMTGLGQERDLGPVAESGVAALLTKPVHVANLRASLRIALGLQGADAPPLGVTAQAPPATREPKHGRLLLAEDNLINQKVAVAMLASAGYRVDTVLNGTEAVEAATTHVYDAILMDCQMPQMNGYEATAAIRAQEGDDRHTPIIAMTAGARREDRERCLIEGMDSYLAKPVSKDALLELVARSVRIWPPTSAPPSIDPPGVEAIEAVATTEGGVVLPDEITIDPLIFDELRALGRASDDDLVGEVSNAFVDATDALLIDLHAAIDVDDAFAVSRIAHAIRGGASQLGGRRLAMTCDHLEAMATRGIVTDGVGELHEIEAAYDALCRELAPHLSSRNRHEDSVST